MGRKIGDFNVQIEVEDGDVKAGLRAARRNVRRTEREATRKAGEETILPRVRARMPGFVRHLAAIRADFNGGFVTLMGTRKLKRAAGLLNFGGDRLDRIVPRRGGGLTINGRVVKAVNERRHYRGRHDIEEGRSAGMPHFADAMRDQILRSFSEAGFETSS